MSNEEWERLPPIRVPARIERIIWIGIVFFSFIVYPVWVGCAREGDIEKLATALDEPLEDCTIWSPVQANIASRMSSSKGANFSRYGSVLCAGRFIPMNAKEIECLTKRLSAEELTYEWWEGKPDGEIETSIDPAGEWVDREMNDRQVYRVTVTRTTTPATIYEWMLSLD